RKAAEQGVLGVLRGRVREHGEARDGLPGLLAAVRGAKLAHHARDCGEIALDEGLVIHRGWPTANYFFFFAGAGAFLTGGVAAAPPSATERLSSTSTVWVMASLPLGAGWAAAGAMVCVCALFPESPERPWQAATASGNVISNSSFRKTVTFV